MKRLCCHLRILTCFCSHLRVLPPLLPSCLSALTFMSFLHCCLYVLSLLSFSCPISTVALMSCLCMSFSCPTSPVAFETFLCSHLRILTLYYPRDLPLLLPFYQSFTCTLISTAQPLFHPRVLSAASVPPLCPLPDSVPPSCPLCSLCSTLVSTPRLCSTLVSSLQPRSLSPLLKQLREFHMIMLTDIGKGFPT
jgi:hypothetical protein